MIGEVRRASEPRHKPPAGSVDTHTHIYVEPYPFESASYAIPRAPLTAHLEMMDTIGISRAVLVQPDAYLDHTMLVSNLAAANGRLVGVAVANNLTTPDTLYRLHAAGVRGLRFTLRPDPRTDRPYQGSASIDDLPRLTPTIAALGWHVQLWADLHRGIDIAQSLDAQGIPTVLDHMGWPDLDEGVSGGTFSRLRTALTRGTIWVKLVVCRFYKPGTDERIRQFHDVLVATRPDRMLWGTDWPFVGMGESAPDPAVLLDLLHDWVDDARLISQILINNPAALYGVPTC